MKNSAKIFAITVVAFAISLAAGFIPQLQMEVLAAFSDYYSPYDVAYSPNGSYIAVSDITKGNVAIINTSTNNVDRTVALNGQPKGVAWSSSNMLYVAEYDGKNVAEIDPTDGSIDRRFQTGRKPFGVAVAGTKLVVTDFGSGKLTVVNLSTGSIEGSATVDNYPAFVDTTPNNTYAVVAHFTPTGRAFDTVHASRISFVNISTRTVTANVELPNGSSAVYDIQCSPNGNWVYVAHTLAKTNIGTAVIDTGWLVTNAISVINASTMTYYTTFLLDTLYEGASTPWGLAISSNSNTLWVSIAGTHQVYKIDLYTLHDLMANGASPSGPWDPTAYYNLTNKTSSKNLDNPGGSTSDGTQMIQWNDSNGTNSNQSWIITDAGGGYYFLKNGTSGKYLDNMGSTADGGAVCQWSYSGSNNQQWQIINVTGNYYKVKCRTSGKCIDNDGSLLNDAPIVQRTDDGNNDQ